MARLSEAPRRDGETAFPDLGTILDYIEEARERYTTPSRPKLNTMPVVEGMKLLEG